MGCGSQKVRIGDEVEVFVARGRVARLATVDEGGVPSIIPICYAYDGRNFYTPVDKKPKSLPPYGLKRIRNILGNPLVAVLIDRWSEDWGELAYVILRGRAEVITSGEEYDSALVLLEEKYEQYRRMGLKGLGLPVIKICPHRITSWGRLSL
jgi:PPOX class probable F420-dependent enzyme